MLAATARKTSLNEFFKHEIGVLSRQTCLRSYYFDINPQQLCAETHDTAPGMKQSTALAVLQSGSNVFLTGQAGAGKTYVLRQYIAYLRARQVAVAVTASTGIAATHMGGQTLHAWSGMGIRESLEQHDLERMAKNAKLVKALKTVQVLVIDEISMLHARQFAMLDELLRHFRKSSQAFGGVQLLLCGDFFQLPPVGPRGQASREKFVFMSPAWLAANLRIAYLHEQHRQNEGPLTAILGELRSGDISGRNRERLQDTAENTLAEPLTRLYTHNNKVDAINQEQLARLSGKAYIFSAKTQGASALVDTLASGVRAPEQLSLKVGARVMFVRNNPEQGIHNGTLGEIIGFVNDEKLGPLPQVRLRDGGVRTVSPEDWSIDNEQGEVLARYTQIPLNLAWAITVHKSQGMTLDAAEMDLSACFEPGQGYVALSRLRDLQGLRLLGMNEMALCLDKLAVKADARFLALSEQTEAEWLARGPSAAQTEADAFILRAGGTLDANTIAEREAAQGRDAPIAQRAQKGDTQKATRQLYEQGLSLTAIATERGLKVNTIISHLAELATQDASFDLSRIQPDADSLQRIGAAVQAVAAQKNADARLPDGSLRLKPIVDYVQAEHGPRYDYDAVRLALLFIDSSAI